MHPLRILSVVIVLSLLATAPVRAESSPAASSQASVVASDPAFSSWLMGSPSGSGKSSYGVLPSGLFDPSRFTISNTMRFGYSSGGPIGGGSAGLFTSSLGYRLKPNMGLQVDVGAHINPAYGVEGMSKGVFLQGAAFSWRPTTNSLFRIEYQDMRSPLQYGYGGYGGAPYSGYRSPFNGSPADPLLGDPSRN